MLLVLRKKVNDVDIFLGVCVLDQEKENQRFRR